MNFMEDSSESFPAGVIEKPRHVFKEKKLRPFGFSHPCDFMKESSSGVGKTKSPSADGKWLTRKSGTNEVNVG
jgi:hypothetical protein